VSNYVQIANLAASLIGTEARVTSPDDDRTLPRAVKAVWDIERRATIRDGEWNFACRREALPALAGLVSYPFGYAYQLPAEALRLLEVLNSSARESYAIEGRQIYANTGPPLYVRFLVDEPNESFWDEQFCDAFAARLAWTIGRRIAGSAYDMATGFSLYKDKLAAAKSADARESPPMQQEEVGWIIARTGNAFYDPLKMG